MYRVKSFFINHDDFRFVAFLGFCWYQLGYLRKRHHRQISYVNGTVRSKKLQTLKRLLYFKEMTATLTKTRGILLDEFSETTS